MEKATVIGAEAPRQDEQELKIGIHLEDTHYAAGRGHVATDQ